MKMKQDKFLKKRLQQDTPPFYYDKPSNIIKQIKQSFKKRQRFTNDTCQEII